MWKATAPLFACESELFGTLTLAESEVSDRWILAVVGLGTIKQIWAAGLVATLACQACNLGEEEVARNDFTAELVHAVCDTVPACCRNAELQFEPLHCRELTLRPLGGQLNAPAVHYDAEEGAKCIEMAHNLSARCEEVPDNICAKAFRGLVPPGGQCLTSYECDPGPMGLAVCSPEGVCVLPARGVIGQPCSYTCQSGAPRSNCKSVYGSMGPAQTACFEDEALYCYLPPGEGPATCQPAVDCRQRLDPEHTCPVGGYCDQATGNCVGFSPVGGPCGPSGGRCNDAAFCNGTMCVPKQPVTARCELPEHCSSGRCSGGFCTLFSTAAAAMCRGSTS